MNDNLALESALAHFQKDDGNLAIGGRTAASLAEEYGTPLYLYSRDVLHWRHKVLKGFLPEGIQVYYAVKANPHREIIGLMSELYDGLDISSRGEMEKAMDAGVSPALMSFAGPGKRISELDFAISGNIGSISIESEQEMLHIRSICKKRGITARVMIRVNPSFDLTQSGMGMGGPRQFGIDADQVPDLLERLRDEEFMDFQGIHIFSGSQNLNAQAIVDHFDKIVGYVLDVGTRMNLPMKVINIGGGLGIPYFAHDRDLELNTIGVGLSHIIKKYDLDLKKTLIRMELGRFLVGESGIYLSKVLYRKMSQGKIFIVIDGGMHHYLAASGNLGQSLTRRPMPVTTASRLDGTREKVTVVGPLCTPLDTFGTVEIPHAEEGDLIAVMNSGAYGLTASPVNFLSHDPPCEVLV
jgi:diaminopimelate decarboxylase